MSIECGECERDLRGEHDISCSRYRYDAYIVINWSTKRADGHVLFPLEDLDDVLVDFDPERKINDVITLYFLRETPYDLVVAAVDEHDAEAFG